jgi:hypothetical protein
VRRQQPQSTELKLVDSAAELHGSAMEGPGGDKGKLLAEQVGAGLAWPGLMQCVGVWGCCQAAAVLSQLSVM